MLFRFSLPISNEKNISEIILNFLNRQTIKLNTSNYFNKKNYLKIYIKNNNLIILSKNVLKDIKIIYEN